MLVVLYLVDAGPGVNELLVASDIQIDSNG